MLHALLVTVLVGAVTVTLPARAQSRGELLYTTHCMACHTAQMHWRSQRVARDWPSLKVEVRRWQAAASLAWDDDDIVEVARYLNETVYRFEVTPGALSLRGAAGRAATTGMAAPFNRRPA